MNSQGRIESSILPMLRLLLGSHMLGFRRQKASALGLTTDACNRVGRVGREKVTRSRRNAMGPSEVLMSFCQSTAR